MILRKTSDFRTIEPWISVAEVAAHLGVKRDTVYKWLERKKVPAHKVGRLWKFKLSEVDQWVVSGSAQRGQVEYRWPIF